MAALAEGYIITYSNKYIIEYAEKNKENIAKREKEYYENNKNNSLII
jgi:hypothetical protein